MCPTCRAVIPDSILAESTTFAQSRPPCDPDVTDNDVNLPVFDQERWQALYEKQRRQGGIIGLEGDPEPEAEVRWSTVRCALFFGCYLGRRYYTW